MTTDVIGVETSVTKLPCTFCLKKNVKIEFEQGTESEPAGMHENRQPVLVSKKLTAGKIVKCYGKNYFICDRCLGKNYMDRLASMILRTEKRLKPLRKRQAALNFQKQKLAVREANLDRQISRLEKAIGDTGNYVPELTAGLV